MLGQMKKMASDDFGNFQETFQILHFSSQLVQSINRITAHFISLDADQSDAEVTHGIARFDS